jgi:hypothetical protein
MAEKRRTILQISARDLQLLAVWRTKPAVVFVQRRPGFVRLRVCHAEWNLCRRQLYRSHPGPTEGRQQKLRSEVCRKLQGHLLPETGRFYGAGNVETGTANLGNATLVVMSNGRATLPDAESNVLAQGTLAPVADTGYLWGASDELGDPCGLFTFRVTTGNSQQGVFLTFQGRAVLFSSFPSKLPEDPSNTSMCAAICQAA